MLRRKKNAARMRLARQNETHDQTQTRMQRDSEWHRATRSAETDQQKQERLRNEAKNRRKKMLTLQNAGFDYQPNIESLILQRLGYLPAL